MKRPSIILLSAFALVFTLAGASAARDGADLRPLSPPSGAKTVIQVYKSPTCGCCTSWVEHIRDSGFQAEVIDVTDEALQQRKSKLGVGPRLASCHTAIVNGYVVEGHVPAADVKRLLAEGPDARGLIVPGMVPGSPGMEQGGVTKPYDVLLLAKDGSTTVYSHHGD